MFLIKLLIVIGLIFITSCNSGKSEEEMEELWSKAQTTGQIIERSGTAINPTIDKDLAMRDAQTRLQTGGVCLEKRIICKWFDKSRCRNKCCSWFNWDDNQCLSLESFRYYKFMPLSSADPIGELYN